MSSKTWHLPEPVHDWLVERVIDEPEALGALRRETAELSSSAMQISPEQGEYMRWLVTTLGVRRALEVGTFTGYSALAVALALPDDGEIVCCDINEQWTDIARRHWAAAGVDHKIRLHLAPASQTLDALRKNGENESFDLAFIDADKGGYSAYYEHALALVRPGGVIAIDNALWSGKVADPSVNDDQTTAIRSVVERVAADPRVMHTLLPIGDGLLLATRR